MWDAWWLREGPPGGTVYGGPDGRVISVKTPAGIWVVDGPSAGQPELKVARTGEPPKITAWPPVRIDAPARFYAFLIAGVLKVFPLTAHEADEVAAEVSSNTSLPLSVVEVRPGSFAVMETSVALRHQLRIMAGYGGSRQEERERSSGEQTPTDVARFTGPLGGSGPPA
jgi:hypothetical protein